MPEDLSEAWNGLVSRPRLEEYREKFKDYFVFTRRDGILEARMHTNGGPFVYSFAGHNSWSQAWQTIGNDPENEVLIITGTGDVWHDTDFSQFEGGLKQTRDEKLKLAYDSGKLLENFIFGIDIPTIAAVNGPNTAHTEFALACDITLCSENASFWDPHFVSGAAPGDGLGLTLHELLGTKRSSYYMYTCALIDASRALEFGLVNEVLPRDRLVPRAWELAEMIMKQSKSARLMTHAIATRPWKQRLVSDFGFQLYHELFGGSVEGPNMRRIEE